ncbi:hypothetical protein [Streptomyces roseifaciens]|uniref:hypothetical protein n=1 Tax=Streptomyces roseifaciens TaxID=1488406 RepID=UPI0007181D9A|nr:hypothetical protein [Streptomyces roseifaciens]
MPFAIETFQYPNGAKLSQDQGIVLGKGDGHILLTDCGSTQDITVKARVGQTIKDFCFTVKGKQGYLVLEIADAFGIWTKDHPVQATVRANGERTVIDAPKNDYTPFGEGSGSAARAVLLELRVTG